MQASFFSKLANVFDSGEKPAISENQQAGKNDFSNIVVDHVTGRRHQNYFEDCEDYSGYCISDTRATIAVSDGCSSAKEARSAARISVEYAIEFFQDKDWNIIEADEESQEKLVAEFISSLQAVFRTSGKDFKQLCATLSVASFDRMTNKYLVLSIGDGYVSAYTDESTCRVILPPFNRDGDPSRTCFGNSDDAVELTQIEIGSVDDKHYTGFVICSDGASSLYDIENLSYGKRMLSLFADAAKNSDEALVHEKILELQSQKTYDDISVGVMMITRNDALATKIAIIDENTDLPDEDFDDTEDEVITSGTVKTKLENIDIPIQVSTLILKNFEEHHELTIQELVDLGLCKQDKILSTMIPFIQEEILIYQGDKFILLPKAED